MSLYRRGKVWVTASASDIDLAKDGGKIEVIQRFSEKYFELIQKNSRDENKVMASQQKDEELLIRLRGKAYLVK